MSGSAAAVQGTVVEFDEERGTGQIETAEGRRLFFHCTAIADGSRTVEPGRRVTFVVLPGHLGRWEAGEIRKG